jgi:hypothetical protein
MSDAMQVAKQRRQDYKKNIVEMEKEIAELHELIADLDSFIEFGDALMTDGSEKASATAAPDAISAPFPKAVADAPEMPKRKTAAPSDTNEQISKALSQRANS